MQKGGSDPDAVLNALIEELGITGGTVNFSISGIGYASAGRQSLNVVFQPGTNPNTAANNAATGWLGVLRGLAGSGEYSGLVSAVQVEGGYILAISVTVEQPGSSGGDDDNEPTPEPDPGYTLIAENSYSITTAEGFNALVTLKGDEIADTNITLNCDVTLPADWPYSINYKATFDGGNYTVSGVNASNAGGYNAMFTWLTGTVENVKFDDVAISGGSYNGVVAGYNVSGTVSNCHVLSGKISGNSSGGLVGYNSGMIDNCTVSVSASGDTIIGGVAGSNAGGTIANCSASCTVTGRIYVGSVVGRNENGGSIENCTAEGTVSGSQAIGGVAGVNFKASITNCHSSVAVTGSESRIGGVVGDNSTNGSIIACSSTGSVTGEGANTQYLGGVAGNNTSQVIGCYSTGSVSGEQYIGGVVGLNLSGAVVTACYHSTGAVSCTNVSPNAGGVIGRHRGSVFACYWSGSVTGTTDSTRIPSPHGLGNTTSQDYSASNDNASPVDNNWTDAMDDMNEKLSSYGWQYVPGSGSEPLKLAK